MTPSKRALALLLPLTTSTPLLASMDIDPPSHSTPYFRFERAYSAEQYERFFKTVHLSSPTYPFSCISGDSRNQFLRDAFYYGLQSLNSTSPLLAANNPARFNIYKTAIALVNMTAATPFSVAFNNRVKRGKILHNLTGIIDNILTDISSNRHVPSANDLRYPIKLSRLILRVGHFEDILETHQKRFGFDESRTNKWMRRLWNDLNTLRDDSRTVVIETLMAKMILEYGYQPAGIADPLHFAANLLSENHTHSSGTHRSSSYARSAPDIHHLTSRTTAMVEERAMLCYLIHQKQTIEQEPHEDSSPLSSDSHSMNVVE